MTVVRLIVLASLALAALIWPVSANAGGTFGIASSAGMFGESGSLVVLGGVLLGVSSLSRRRAQ